MIDYTLILRRKYPNAKWNLNGDDYAGLHWLDDSAKPTKIALDNLWQTVLDEIESEQIAKSNAKAALLDRLGITEEEAALLLSL
jgi:hypothetical protein